MPTNKNKTRYVILGLLNEEHLSGYEIKRIIDMRLSFFWNESFGQIYPELKKLMLEGLIVASDQSDKRGKESKKYEITTQGKIELQEWLKVPVEKELIRYEILLKLYFSNETSSKNMLNHVKEFEINHRKQRELFDKFESQLKENIDVHSNHRQILMVLSFGQKVWDAYAHWCEETIKLLEQVVAEHGGIDNE
ncbi:DNA-binding transcriptional regulator, PadR family [Paenibacillus sophorae]|uniref:DNA-binding transcriptional regulator, PadR family n=1 Tax=Paenibacillus sophorae TaxID=1333845 RepID=A0A1H8QWH5_9BACL|nr:PadR family transcriptional regulator [Paenibacillus sophorae]QWU14856.1 PadR family transcriptional regulator [Paenibacillus sophorae]SEO58406.1 DNA-binding transcriptional regulator, PadR family [Paenibacillus sophorae]